MKKLTRIISLFAVTSICSTALVLLSGCASPGPTTPEELNRAREVLNETSPRNMNDHPKAVQNVRYRFDTEPSCPN